MEVALPFRKENPNTTSLLEALSGTDTGFGKDDLQFPLRGRKKDEELRDVPLGQPLLSMRTSVRSPGPSKKLNVVMHTRNPRAGVAETRGALLIKQSRWHGEF